jgi:hypothetical protein
LRIFTAYSGLLKKEVNQAIVIGVQEFEKSLDF